MGTGYTRNDTVNNIADGNVINAADLDGEFDAIESAFNSSTGHTHDGTTAEGGAITVLGPSQEFVANATEVTPSSNAALSLGTAALQFNNLHVDGKAFIDGIGESTLVDAAFKVQFRDTALFINSSVDGQLDLEADTQIELTAPTVSLTNDLKLKSDSAVLTFGEDDDTTLTHTDGLGLTLNGANKLTFGDSASFVHQSSDGVLRIDGEATIDLNASTAVTISNDLKLDSDSAVLTFGADDDISITHVADTGLDLKAANGFDLNLQTADTTIESGNTIGKITFNAPNEASGTDAVLVGAAITALAEATFDSATNSTALVFSTNTSAAATERVRITSAGDVGIGTNSPSAKLDVVGGVEITGEIDIDNININGNTIISTDTNGNINLTPNGTGEVNITKVDIDGGTIDGTVIGGSTPAAISGTTGAFSGNLTVDTNTLFVNAANNRVGVGTSSPAYELDVVGVSDTSIRVRATGAGSGDDALLRMSVGNADASNYIQFGDDSDGDAGYIRYQHANDSLQIGVNAAERMRITSTGSVGIGTNSPTGTLDVASASTATAVIRSTGTSDAVLRIQNSDTGTGANGIYLGRTSATNYLWTYENEPWVFGTNNTERMRIDSSGRVGIGTSSPDTLLYVNSGGGGGGDTFGGRVAAFESFAPSLFFVDKTSSSQNFLVGVDSNAFQFFSTPNTDGSSLSQVFTLLSDGTLRIVDAIQHDGDTNTAIRFPAADTVTVETAGSERVRVDASGNVGIGVTSMQSALQVAKTQAVLSGTGNTYGVHIYPTTSGDTFVDGITSGAGGAGITLRNYFNGTYNNIISGNTTANTTTFQTGGVERMRIDSSGNVGIGTSSPGDKLVVIGTGSFTGALQLTANSSLPAVGAAFYRPTANTLGFVTTSAERMRINNDGDLLVATTSSPSNVALGNSDHAGFVYSRGEYIAVNRALASPKLYINSSITSGTATQVSFVYNTSTVGTITSSSAGTAYNTSSDYRLKENVVPLSGAADRLAQIPVHRFNFIADPDRTVDGFLAHEVQDIVPEAVHGTKDEVDADGNPVYQGIDQSKLVPLLTAALQEALTEIADLKARVTALEAQP